MTTAEFIRQFPLVRFGKGEVILQGGDISDTLLAIRRGFAKVLTYNEAGTLRFLWIAGKYDIIPSEHLFLHRRPLDFFYEALTDVSAYQIPKSDFLQNARVDSVFLTDVAKGMSTHYDDLLTRIDSMGQSSVHRRLLSTLYHISERFSAGDTVDLYALGLTLTHQDLADMIGATRETVTIELQKLRQEGYISYTRQSLIVHRSECQAGLQIE